MISESERPPWWTDDEWEIMVARRVHGRIMRLLAMHPNGLSHTAIIRSILSRKPTVGDSCVERRSRIELVLAAMHRAGEVRHERSAKGKLAGNRVILSDSTIIDSRG